MAEYFTPGVYVEEYDNSPRSIEGVGTSIAGFIGMAEKGPVEGAPVFVTNFKDFKRIFGGFLNEFTYGEYRFLANSVEQFFAHGGTSCFVTRVAPADAKAASKTVGAMTVTAKNPGKWGNRVQVSVTASNKKKMQLIAVNKKKEYTAKSVDGFREGDIVTINGEYNQIKMIYDDTVVFEKAFTENVVDTSIIPKNVVSLCNVNVAIRYNDEVENFADLSLNPMAPNYISNKLVKSEIVDLAYAPSAEEVDAPLKMIFGEEESGMFTLEGGSDGSIAKVDAATFIGEDDGPGKRTGIQSFLENNLVSMMAIPGVTIPEVVVSLVVHCEKMKNRVAVLDMPADLTKPADLIEYRSMIDSTYAAMYHPWIQVYDRSSSRNDFIPPSGAIMGIYARTDVTRGVHKAPANESVYATGLSVNYTKAEQDILNPEGINLIRSFPGQGIRVWGARTASSNSAFKYINVRRLFIYVEESIKANTNWVVFEPNDTTLWNRVNLTISGFLNNLWREGMLVGASEAEAYFVEIGQSTMSRDDIASGRLICNVGISPSKPAEFVVFRVTQFTADADNQTAAAAEAANE